MAAAPGLVLLLGAMFCLFALDTLAGERPKELAMVEIERREQRVGKISCSFFFAPMETVLPAQTTLDNTR